MAEIRPLERSDLPTVVALLHTDLTAATPKEEMARSITGTMIDSPWADEELPSLVATEDDEVIGFVGSQARRFRFGDRVLRGVCISHLTVASGRRGGAAGALLLRRMLNSGQDFTFSDTANYEVARIWKVLGGELDHGRACDWMMVLHPGSLLRAVGRRLVLRRTDVNLPVGILPLGAFRRHQAPGAGAEPGAEISGEDTDAAAIVEQMPGMARGFQLRGDYDEAFLAHVFAEMEAHFGSVVKRLVRRGDRPAGWYAYVPARRGVSRVLHLMATDTDGDAVLGDLVDNARDRESAVISGRLEPHLTGILEPLGPALVFAQRPVIHCHDPEIRATLASSKSLLTQLDGEWFVL
jgi:hypothetical protein